MFSPSITAIQKSITHIWDVLTRPSPSIIDPQTRQQSRLLASMLLAAILVIFFLILFSTQTGNALSEAGLWLLISSGLMVVTWGAYLLTRKGHVRFAVSALLILASTGIFVPALIVGDAGSYNSLFYLFTIVLFACTFLEIRTALFIAVIHLLLLFLFKSNFPSLSADAIISGPLSFNLFLSVFILLLSYHQRRSATEHNDELAASEHRYRKISELISDYALYMGINEDGSMVREWITDSFSRVTGYLPEEITVNNITKLFHPESMSQLEADHQRVKKGESTSSEYRIITKQGALRWLNLVRQPAWDEGHTRVVGFYIVARDVTEYKQIEAQKIKLLLEQEQFVILGHLVQALSHDFRTALATIETSRYLIERLVGDAVRPTVQPKLDSIQQSVKHLAAQLEHLHMVSFLTSPSFDLCNLNTSVSSLISEQQANADKKHIQLVFEADDRLPTLRLDVDKIEKAIRHLVANALSHTPDNGSVTVYTRYTADQAIIEVQNTGPGITPEIIEHIFEPFFRADSARTISSGGVGLGLTIVKMIVEAHSGTINAHSQLGIGSTFTIRLPLREEISISA